MKKMGRPPVVPLVLFFLFLQVLAPAFSNWTQAQAPAFTPAKGVVISELLPYARGGGIETEFIIIHNTGNSEIDVGGWKICDDHHCAILVNGTARTILDPRQEISIAQNATIYLKMNMHGYFPTFAYEGIMPIVGTDPLSNGSVWPAMVNDGDFIWLEDGNGTIKDAVAFGKDYQGNGWTGGPASAPRMSWTMVREHRISNGNLEFQDTNTSVDWPIYRSRRAGFVSVPQLEATDAAQVTALRFPEDGGVLAGLVQNASTQVLLNTYQFTSKVMEDILIKLAKKGVDVRVIIEGHPVGGLSTDEKNILWNLDNWGCNVQLIWSNSTQEGTGPFGLDHAKYLVIDGILAIVMSENMVGSALGTTSSSANRGWGLAVKEGSFVDHLQDLFFSDQVIGKKVKDVLGGQGSSTYEPEPLAIKPPASSSIFTGNAKITALVSPDDTEDVMLSLIEGATKRIYIEQLSCDLDWHLQSGVTEKQRSPFLEAIVDAARRGVDVRVLLDSAYLDSSDNEKVVAFLNEIANRENLTLAARLADIPNITVVHNKGLIVDDTVLVSSINWVDSAVRDNREVGVAVTMDGLDDLYVSYFMKDWEAQAPPPKDGPGPDDVLNGNSTWVICGSFLAFGAISLVLVGMMRRGRR